MREGLMFSKILHANDGSEPSFHALLLALAIAKQNQADLHMVCVEEMPYVPEELIGEVGEAVAARGHRFHAAQQRAHATAEKSQVRLNTHVLLGQPVRDIVMLAAEFDADLLIIGTKGHSALYERLMGSRANRIMQLAPCPVLVAK
jgi:nucleotide-binding universal stress UspA family protein